MPHVYMLYAFFLGDVNLLAVGVGAAQPGFNTNKIGTGFGPKAQVIKMREFYR